MPKVEKKPVKKAGGAKKQAMSGLMAELQAKQAMKK